MGNHLKRRYVVFVDANWKRLYHVLLMQNKEKGKKRSKRKTQGVQRSQIAALP